VEVADWLSVGILDVVNQIHLALEDVRMAEDHRDNRGLAGKCIVRIEE
jgi:hypothetical protein